MLAAKFLTLSSFFLLFSRAICQQPQPQQLPPSQLPSVAATAEVACNGDLELAERMAQLYSEEEGVDDDTSRLAGSWHIRGQLSLLLRCDVDSAVDFHIRAKAANPTLTPPLAQLHLNGQACGGLGDLFFVMAVITKQLVDNKQTAESCEKAGSKTDCVGLTRSGVTHKDAPTWNISTYYLYDRPSLISSLSNLLTLASDSGLYKSSEAIYAQLERLDPSDSAILIRGALLTPGVFENTKHIKDTRRQLEDRVNSLYNNMDALRSLKTLDEFVLSPTFYFVYQGFPSDQDLLSKLHSVYAAAYPKIAEVHPSLDDIVRKGSLPTTAAAEKLTPLSTSQVRVGFVSSHFRRHSICKLFCGIMTGLAEHTESVTTTTGNSDVEAVTKPYHPFKVFVFSSLAQHHEDETTRTLSANKRLSFVRSGMTVVGNREEVTNRKIDILVYLDVGMEPSTVVWAGARLAPVQV
jgi:hypothetical protein